jgi:hypothetical protein
MKYILSLAILVLINKTSFAQTPEQVKKMLCRQWQLIGGTEDGESIPMDEEGVANSFMTFLPDGTLIATNEGESDTLKWKYTGTKKMQFDEDGDVHPCKIIKISNTELVLESNEEDVVMRSFFKYQPIIYNQKPVSLLQLEQNVLPGFSGLKKLFSEILYTDISTEQKDGLVYTSFKMGKNDDEFFRIISKGDDVVGSYAEINEDVYLAIKKEMQTKGYHRKDAETSKGPELYIGPKYAIQFAPLSTSRGTFTVDIYELTAFKF